MNVCLSVERVCVRLFVLPAAYAFAIVLLELIQGGAVYRGMRGNDVIHAVLTGKRPMLPRDVHPDVAAIICSCWNQQPEQRPSFATITLCLQTLIKELTASGSELGLTVTSTLQL
jgi:hypothetical protein